MVTGFLFSNLPLALVVAGAALIIAEAFAPGAHFFVVGVALFAAGLAGVLLPFTGAIQLGIMAVVVILSALATLYVYREADIYGGEGKGETKDSSSLRGKTGRVTQRVTPTEGRIKLAEGGFNPNYEARSIDGEIPEGEEVMVVDPGGGNVVTVESLSSAADDIDRELAEDRQRSRETEQN